MEQIIVKFFWMMATAFLAWTGVILREIWSEQKAQGLLLQEVTTKVAVVKSNVMHIEEKVQRNEAQLLTHERRLDLHDLSIQANRLV